MKFPIVRTVLTLIITTVLWLESTFSPALAQELIPHPDKPLPTGKVKLKAVYKTDKDEPFSGATVTLYANNRKIGEGRVEKSMPNRISIDETLDVGFDTGTPVTEDYETPFDFTGTLDKVTIELKS
jgi:hypothetical protein